MMKKMFFLFVASALLLTGCGGGSSSNNSSSSSSITTNTAPTAKFTTSSQNASNLTKEVNSGTPSLVSSASAQSVPGAVSTLTAGIGSLPAGVTVSYSCASYLPGGISGMMTVDTNESSGITAGTYLNTTFSSCSFAVSNTTFTLSGNADLKYNSYSSSSDYAASVSYSNLSMSIVDTTTSVKNSYGPLSGSFSIVDSNGTLSYEIQLANGGATNLSNANVTYNGTDVTIGSATYVYDSSSVGGIIKVVYSNWTYDTSSGSPIPVSGTITVTDATGNTLVITASAGNVTATYTINGTSTAYTVTFP